MKVRKVRARGFQVADLGTFLLTGLLKAAPRI